MKLNKNKTDKKGISELIAAVLLILVAVVAVVSFETFFNSYQSTLQTKLESQSGTINSVKLDLLQDGELYITNNNKFSFNITSIKVNDKQCDIQIHTINPGTNIINVSSCLANISKNSIVSIALITQNNVIEGKLVNR